MENKTKNLLIVILTILTVLFFYRSVNKGNDISDLESIVSNQNATIEKWKNLDNSNQARINLIRIMNTKYLDMLDTKDSTINRLSILIKKYKKQLDKGGSALVIDTKGNFKDTIPSIIIETEESPIYKASFNKENWVWGNIEASSKNIIADFYWRDEFDLIISGTTKNPFAELHSKNPYTDIENLKVVDIRDNRKKDRWAVGPSVGAGLNSDFKLQSNVGVSVIYIVKSW